MSAPILSGFDATLEILDVSDTEIVEIFGEGMELTKTQIADDIANPSTELGQATLQAIQETPSMSPTGSWDFAQAPTVAGAPIATGGSGDPATDIAYGTVKFGPTSQVQGPADAMTVPGLGYNAINAQTGAAYSFVLDDANRETTLTNAAAITATIQPQNAVDLPVGTILRVRQGGAGQVSFVGGAGVTVIAMNGRNPKTKTQNALVFVRQYEPDKWITYGDVEWSGTAPDVTEAVQDIVGASVVGDGAQITVTYDDTTGLTTVSMPAALAALAFSGVFADIDDVPNFPEIVKYTGTVAPTRPNTARPVIWDVPDSNRPATNGSTLGGDYAAVDNLDYLWTHQ